MMSINKETIAGETSSEMVWLSDVELTCHMETGIFRNTKILKTFEDLLRNLEGESLSYDSILGDDASGRVPALLIRNLSIEEN